MLTPHIYRHFNKMPSIDVYVHAESYQSSATLSDQARSCTESPASSNRHHHSSLNVSSWGPVSVAMMDFFAFTSCVAHHKSGLLLEPSLSHWSLSWFKMWNFVQDDLFRINFYFWKHHTEIFFWLLSFNFVPNPSLRHTIASVFSPFVLTCSPPPTWPSRLSKCQLHPRISPDDSRVYPSRQKMTVSSGTHLLHFHMF